MTMISMSQTWREQATNPRNEMETKKFQLDRLHQMRDEILRIAAKNNARKVYVFGSCARKEETSESDIDFVADFKDHSTLFNVVGLELDLAEFLGCSVDVVTLDRLDMNDSFAENVKKDMVLLWTMIKLESNIW